MLMLQCRRHAGRAATLLWKRASVAPPASRLLLGRSGALQPSLALAGGAWQLHGRSFSSKGDADQLPNHKTPSRRELITEFNARLDAASSDADVAMEVFADIQKAQDVELRPKRTLSTIITALAKQGRVEECVRVIDFCWDGGVRPTTAAYTVALKELSIAGKCEDVLRVFDAMRDDGSIARTWTWVYKTALISTVKLERAERVVEIFKVMQKGEVAATSVYLHVLGAACKSQQHDLVFAILEHMRENNEDMVSAYLGTFRTAAKAEQHTFVLELFRHTQANGVELSVECYEMVLKSCSRMGDVQLALSIRDAWLRNGRGMTEKQLCWLIMAAMEAEQFELAFETLAGIQIAGGERKMLCITVSNLISSMAKKKRLKECVRALDYCWEQGLPPKAVSYAIALRELSIGEQLEDVLRVFDAMRKDAWITEKGAWTYRIALQTAVKLRRHEKIWEILNDMRESGVDATKEYPVLLGVACKSKQPDLMFAVFDYMHENGLDTTVAYTNTLGAASNSSQHELVCEILDHMIRNSVNPSIQMYDTILKSCARDGDVKMALDLQRAIVERGFAMTESTYSSLIWCAVSADHWELAQDAMASMQSQGLKPTMRTYHLALVECLHRKQWNKAVSIFEAMPQGVRAQLGGSSLRAVILGHANAESEELKLRAVSIFNDHKEKCDIDEYKAALSGLVDTNQLEVVSELAHAS